MPIRIRVKWLRFVTHLRVLPTQRPTNGGAGTNQKPWVVWSHEFCRGTGTSSLVLFGQLQTACGSSSSAVWWSSKSSYCEFGPRSRQGEGKKKKCFCSESTLLQTSVPVLPSCAAHTSEIVENVKDHMSTFGYEKARRVAWSHTTHIISRIIKMMIVVATSCRRRTRKLSFFRTELSEAVEPRRVCEKFVYALCDRENTSIIRGSVLIISLQSHEDTHTCPRSRTHVSLHTHIHFVSIHARWMPLFIIAHTDTLRQYTRKVNAIVYHCIHTYTSSVY